MSKDEETPSVPASSETAVTADKPEDKPKTVRDAKEEARRRSQEDLARKRRTLHRGGKR